MRINIKTTGEKIDIDLSSELTDTTTSQREVYRQIQNGIDEALTIDPYRTSALIVVSVAHYYDNRRKIKIVFDLVEETAKVVTKKKRVNYDSLFI